ncbi:unnamed protein product [Brassica rapa subsp. trilocularis]
MGYDRISALPDCLITEILLWLPTRDSVKTSVLSTRWRNLWLDVPGLDIKFLSSNANTITSFIKRFLEFNRDARLRKFKITYDTSKGHDPFGIREWIATAISRGAQHLDVVYTFVRYMSFKEFMPLDIYKSKTLVSLKLVEVGMSNPDFVVSLPCLKNMHLEKVTYSGKDPSFMEKLISGCPVLEDLTVFRSSDDNVLVLRVRSKSLKRFSVRSNRWSRIHSREFALEIDAPGLKYMKLGDQKSERIVVKNLRSLFMVDIDSIFNVGSNTNLEMKKDTIRDFLNGISCVRHMIVSQLTLEVLYRYLGSNIPMFNNLYRLEVSRIARLEHMLPDFLESFPNLKHLTLCVVYLPSSFWQCIMYLNHLNVEKHEGSIVPRCLLSTLECVEIREFTGEETRTKKKIMKQKKEPLMNVARYILVNSLVLKKLILILSPATNQISDIAKELLTIRKGLAEEPVVNVNGSVWDFPSHSSSPSPQSTFSKNLNSLVASIPNLHANTYNFYNLSVGDISDQDRVEAIGVCNRVVLSVDCRSCIFQAALNLTTSTSPQHREGYWRSTNCMFRYSDKPIFGVLETNPVFEALNPNKSTGDRDEFARLQIELLNGFRKRAAAGGSKRKYVQGSGPGPNSSTFLGAVMCTPDLSEKDCNDCLIFGFANATKGRTGLRWFCPSCSFQIQTNLRFFLHEYEYESDPPSDQEPDNWSQGVDKTVIILATVGSVVGFAIFVVCLYFILKRKQRKEKQRHEGKDVVENQIIDENVLRLDFDTIRLATDDFSPGNQLGEGGFGVVYKGVLDSGEEIAVKRLSMKSGQGDNEFINEVSLVAKLHHRNLVRLIGFCLEGQERLLIYDLFKNTSLDHFIFDNDRRMVLEWETRYKIIAGVARGLLYLHEDSRFKVIHRDLKASNVLLDDAMYPKISDFGMAKLFDTDQPCQTRFTSRVAGTYGYMAPEYAMNGKFSVKTDVFSFGVLVLEIITGKRNNWSPEDKSSLFLLSYVWKNWREGRVLNIVDPSLIQTRGLSDEIMKCIHVGLLCVQEKAESRPTMASVVLMLNASSFTLLRPSQPGFYPGDGESTSGSPPTMTLNSVTITKVDPR